MSCSHLAIDRIIVKKNCKKKKSNNNNKNLFPVLLPLVHASWKQAYLILTPLNPTFIQLNWGLYGYKLFLLFLLKNIDCRYSLEPPHWDSAHNLYFEQKYEIHVYQNFLSENFHVLVVKFSVYLNRHDFVMYKHLMYRDSFPGIYDGFQRFIYFFFLFVVA